MNCIPQIPKQLIDVMMKASVECVNANPDLKEHPYLCENVYWTPLNDCRSFTLHTHTVKDQGGEYPSEADKRTTLKLKKQNLCIINTEGHWVKCWNKRDGFEKPIYEKSI